MSVITDVLGAVAPWLTAAVEGGPAGLAVEAATKIAGALGIGDSSIDGIKSALSNLTMTPDQKLALQNSEQDFQYKMKQLGYQHAEQMAATDAGIIKDVNATMISEENSSNKFAVDWRPMWGYVSCGLFAFIGVCACVMAFMALYANDPTKLDFIPKFIMAFIPLFGIAGGVLGINAWHSGVADVVTAKSGVK